MVVLLKVVAVHQKDPLQRKINLEEVVAPRNTAVQRGVVHSKVVAVYQEDPLLTKINLDKEVAPKNKAL